MFGRQEDKVARSLSLHRDSRRATESFVWILSNSSSSPVCAHIPTPYGKWPNVLCIPFRMYAHYFSHSSSSQLVGFSERVHRRLLFVLLEPDTEHNHCRLGDVFVRCTSETEGDAANMVYCFDSIEVDAVGKTPGEPVAGSASKSRAAC